MMKIGIIGVTGYTGIELLRLLQGHSAVTVTHVVTESYVGQEIAEIYPHLRNHVFLQGEKLDIDRLQENCDIVFISLPHGHASKLVQPLLSAGKKVIDIGADFRLKSAKDYQQWYQHPSPPSELLDQATYGLPELGNKKAIARASLIANPGCYPTAALLATFPALQAGIIDCNYFIYDAKSGISGAGRGLSLKNHFCEVMDNIIPYQVAGLHRHTPEIEQALSLIAGRSVVVQFTPHLIPIVRGILVTAYLKLTTPITQDEIIALYQTAYQNETFIRISKNISSVKNVRGTNYCDLSIQVDSRTNCLIITSVIDNLIKGAVGQAIQNMNLMCDFPENRGLDISPAAYP